MTQWCGRSKGKGGGEGGRRAQAVKHSQGRAHSMQGVPGVDREECGVGSRIIMNMAYQTSEQRPRYWEWVVARVLRQACMCHMRTSMYVRHACLCALRPRAPNFLTRNSWLNSTSLVACFAGPVTHGFVFQTPTPGSGSPRPRQAPGNCWLCGCLQLDFSLVCPRGIHGRRGNPSTN
jgi:hypothetical protein